MILDIEEIFPIIDCDCALSVSVFAQADLRLIFSPLRASFYAIRQSFISVSQRFSRLKLNHPDCLYSTSRLLLTPVPTWASAG